MLQPSTDFFKTMTNMFLYWSTDWRDKCVGIAGHTPFDYEEISWLLQAVGAREVDLSTDWCEWVKIQDDYWANLYTYDEQIYQELHQVERCVDNLDCVIVGRNQFSECFLTFLLPYACRNPKMIVLSQEDFVESLYCFDKPTPYRQNDLRIRLHEGLKYLSRIGFEWPTEYWSGHGEHHETSQWASESELKSRFGYSVAQGISQTERRSSLTMAVRVKGLQWVAEFIVNHLIRVNRNNRLKYEAVNKYREDVAWLKRTYYDGSRYTFRWPLVW
jgi:hypothetical protein